MDERFLEGLSLGAYALGPVQSPAEQAAPIYDGPAPRKATGTTYDEAAWQLLSRRHPRLYRRLRRDMTKALRLHAYYIGKVR